MGLHLKKNYSKVLPLTVNYTYMQKIKIEQHGFTAFSWFAGWLFTVGFLNLTLGKGILAIILWPYFIGQAVAMLAK
jgi:hypothetical protein